MPTLYPLSEKMSMAQIVKIINDNNNFVSRTFSDLSSGDGGSKFKPKVDDKKFLAANETDISLGENNTKFISPKLLSSLNLVSSPNDSARYMIVCTLAEYNLIEPQDREGILFYITDDGEEFEWPTLDADTVDGFHANHFATNVQITPTNYQFSGSNVYEVIHNKGYIPRVTILVSGYEVKADILHTDNTTFYVTFSTTTSCNVIVL